MITVEVSISTLFVFLIILFGVLCAIGILFAIIYDLWALSRNPPRRTFSRETLYLGHTFPVIAVLFCSVVCLAVGMLLGHLFFGQAVGP